MIPGDGSAYFDALGGEWDRLRENFYPDEVRDRAIEVAGVGPDRVAVDLGAGTGFLTRGLVERGLRVIAVDSSQVMLDALRERFPDRGLVDCRVGDANRIPVTDGAVDASLANMVLHHVEVPARMIREMARIIRPGGRVVVTDLDTHEHEFLRTEQHDRWMGFERDDVRRWFREAGLTDVTVEDLGPQCLATSCDDHAAVVGIFVASGTTPLSI